MFGFRKKKEADEAVAHKLIIDSIPYALNKSFGRYGIVCEDDGASIWFYATDALFTEIYSAISIGPSGILNGKDVFIVHNAFRERIGLYFDDDFQAGIDFHEKKCLSRSSRCTGFSAWGRDVSLPWDKEFFSCIAP